MPATPERRYGAGLPRWSVGARRTYQNFCGSLLVALLGVSDYASFEFHLNDWIGDKPSPGAQPVRPEMEKLSGIRRLCVYGAEEEGASCPKLAALGIIAEKMPGDHHFDEDYQGVARRILDRLPPPPAAPPPTQARN
jgi:type IV secretory pathway VirJ component